MSCEEERAVLDRQKRDAIARLQETQALANDLTRRAELARLQLASLSGTQVAQVQQAYGMTGKFTSLVSEAAASQEAVTQEAKPSASGTSPAVLLQRRKTELMDRLSRLESRL